MGKLWEIILSRIPAESLASTVVVQKDFIHNELDETSRRAKVSNNTMIQESIRAANEINRLSERVAMMTKAPEAEHDDEVKNLKRQVESNNMIIEAMQHLQASTPIQNASVAQAQSVSSATPITDTQSSGTAFIQALCEELA